MLTEFFNIKFSSNDRNLISIPMHELKYARYHYTLIGVAAARLSGRTSPTTSRQFGRLLTISLVLDITKCLLRGRCLMFSCVPVCNFMMIMYCIDYSKIDELFRVYSVSRKKVFFVR
jgi:hypothetical protein